VINPASRPTPDQARSSSAWAWSFVVAILVLGAAGVVAVVQYTRFAAATETVTHINETIGALDLVVSRLVDAETSQRGYLLTSRHEFLEPYEGARQDIERRVDQVQRLVADDPALRASSERLGTLADQKQREMARVLSTFDAGDQAGAQSIIADGTGKRLMDEIRTVAETMRADETSRLETRANDARVARRATVAFAVGSLLVALALAVVAVSVRRSFERRQAEYVKELSGRLAAEHAALESAERLQEHDRFNRKILDNSHDGIHVLDPAGAIELINQPGVTQLELETEDRVVGRSWTGLWSADAAAAGRAVDAAIASGMGRFQARRPTREGEPRWWDIVVSPIRDESEHVTRLVAIVRDITDHKAAEDERAALLASERTARSEAERATRIKDDFVATLSHELRTPLNAILGWVGVLKHDRRPETVNRAIEVVDRNCRRQTQMIDDLLDIGRISSGKLRLDVHRVDVAAVIEDALASVQPAADAKGVQLVKVLGSAGDVQGDSGRLQQIVWNLISNAIKFTPRGGRVQVMLRRADSQVEIIVSDTGRGIAAELLPEIFQRFRQGDGISVGAHGGLGLGLAIVKSLVEMHGGSVEAHSEGEGRGSVFTVRLPMAVIEIRASRPTLDDGQLPAESYSRLLSSVHVLVLDDEKDGREIVQRLLEGAGASVSSVASAQDALDQLEHGYVPDLILSDIGMPGQDGYEFMRRVRQMDSPVSAVPAAALTALARVEDRKRALLAGYQTHLAKPVDPAELVATVASLTGRTGRFVA